MSYFSLLFSYFLFYFEVLLSSAAFHFLYFFVLTCISFCANLYLICVCSLCALCCLRLLLFPWACSRIYLWCVSVFRFWFYSSGFSWFLLCLSLVCTLFELLCCWFVFWNWHFLLCKDTIILGFSIIWHWKYNIKSFSPYLGCYDELLSNSCPSHQILSSPRKNTDDKLKLKSSEQIVTS